MLRAGKGRRPGSATLNSKRHASRRVARRRAAMGTHASESSSSLRSSASLRSLISASPCSRSLPTLPSIPVRATCFSLIALASANLVLSSCSILSRCDSAEGTCGGLMDWDDACASFLARAA